MRVRACVSLKNVVWLRNKCSTWNESNRNFKLKTSLMTADCCLWLARLPTHTRMHTNTHTHAQSVFVLAHIKRLYRGFEVLELAHAERLVCGCEWFCLNGFIEAVNHPSRTGGAAPIFTVLHFAVSAVHPFRRFFFFLSDFHRCRCILVSTCCFCQPTKRHFGPFWVASPIRPHLVDPCRTDVLV